MLPVALVVINNCLSISCLNGAACTNAVNSFICRCHQDFKGKYCETGTCLSYVSVLKSKHVLVCMYLLFLSSFAIHIHKHLLIDDLCNLS